MKHDQNIGLRAIGLEMLRAFSVLAIVFLSFAHQPLNAEGGSSLYRLADGSIPVFCGGGPAGEKSSKSGECEACRIAANVGLPSKPQAVGVRNPVGLTVCTPMTVLNNKPHEYADVFQARAPPVTV